jgi:hypothetical protein
MRRSAQVDDHQEKLAWARKHLETFKQAVGAFANDSPYRTAAQDEPETGDRVWRIFRNKPLPPDWPLVVGDVVHNLRSALDNLVYLIAQRNTPRDLTEDEAKRLEFLIFDSDTNYLKTQKRCLSLLPTAAQTEIEGLQPYKRTNPANDTLSLLNRLSNVDKHRHLVVTEVVGGVISMKAGDREVIRERSEILNTMIVFEEGAIIARMKGGASLPPTMNVQPKLMFDVFFGEGVSAKDLSIIGLLERVHNYIRDDVFPKFKGFV